MPPTLTLQVPTVTATPAAAVLPLLNDHADAPFGLALLFDSCGWGDGAVGVPGWPRVTPADIPDSAALQAAADAVRQQADAVRELKTTQGLGNKVRLGGGLATLCKTCGVGGWGGAWCVSFLSK